MCYSHRLLLVCRHRRSSARIFRAPPPANSCGPPESVRRSPPGRPTSRSLSSAWKRTGSDIDRRDTPLLQRRHSGDVGGGIKRPEEGRRGLTRALESVRQRCQQHPPAFLHLDRFQSPRFLLFLFDIFTNNLTKRMKSMINKSMLLAYVGGAA